ncbi:MAG: ROK family protein, partial [Propionibacteriaceae bacterium]|nr:ROK family protein [Propionibacteriaceae bacterium]
MARTPASRVLELVRRCGTVKREELARRTGLSPATVARAVSALIDAGLLRYGRESRTDRGLGRPGTPLQIDDRRFVVIGIHRGRHVTTVALGDLTGRVLDARIHRPHPSRPAVRFDGDVIGGLVTELLAATPGRQPLAVGLVAPWRELGWEQADLAEHAHDLLGLDVATSEHIAAMASAEFLVETGPATGTSAFVYARETAGFLVVDHDGERPAVSRETSLNHFPTGSSASCECGRTGCFIATVGDSALAREAYARGWISEPRIDEVFRAAQAGAHGPRTLLAERARV